MSDLEIIDLVKSALIKVRPEFAAGFESVAMSTRFENLRIDSVDTLRMITFLEDKVGFVFQDDDLSRIETVTDLAAIIRKHGR
ncbi:acyl carrier protein [Archangium lipolyticum]|uniref:acyl carrier protein n=1 Tax=Archangium lipolyticum TaxID=2970465 RepID=UPI002149F444|nr:acyl carrier protein [Archangium lipolyticum]